MLHLGTLLIKTYLKCVDIISKQSYLSKTFSLIKMMYVSLGQSYEIKLKKLGDLTDFQGKYLRVS